MIGGRTASAAAGDAATWQLLLGPNGETLQQQHHDQLRWLEEVRARGFRVGYGYREYVLCVSWWCTGGGMVCSLYVPCGAHDVQQFAMFYDSTP